MVWLLSLSDQRDILINTYTTVRTHNLLVLQPFVIIVSFYECPEYVLRVSVVMPCNFRVLTPLGTDWPTGTSPRFDVIVNLSCLVIGFVSQCPHDQIKAVTVSHISTCFAVGCSVVFFAVLLIYSKYHLQIWQKLLIRTSESCEVMCFVGKRHCQFSAAFHRRFKFSLRTVCKHPTSPLPLNISGQSEQ